MRPVAEAPETPLVHFDDLVSTHSTRLFGVARRILASDDLADDALQEALVSLWLRGERPSNPEAWLVRTVVNRSLHARRGETRRRVHERCACALRRYELESESPARGLERGAEHEVVHRALAALPAQHRDVLVLREIEGRDYESVARALGVPVGTVRSRLSRARAALRVQVELMIAAV